MKIFNKLKSYFIQKAYTEGIYADTPQNRKLGRVGMSYAEYNAKAKKTEEEKEKELEEKRQSYEKIKSAITSIIDSLKKNNDYINIESEEGYTIRFQRNFGEENHGLFVKASVKGPDGKTKYFENPSEKGLIDSIILYSQKLGLHIKEEKKNEETEKIDESKNKETILSKMQEAKEKNYGTIMIKGSGSKGDIVVYMNRKRESRWLRDFEAFTVRDSKKNVLFKGESKKEDELIDKLNTYLSKNNIILK